MSEVVFKSSGPVELNSVEGETRRVLVEPAGGGREGHPLVIETLKGTGKNYPMLAAYVTVGPVSWTLKAGTHTMPSRSEGGAPSFIFSMVNEKNPEVFYAVVLDKGAKKEEVETLEDILGRLTIFHPNKKAGPGLALPHIDLGKMPNLNLGAKGDQINELLRKGAQDTQMMINKAGEAASGAFHAAAEMHKKYAPKPKDTPMEVNPGLRDKIVKSKQATQAGAAVAKGVATGMQAATVEIGTSLMSVATGGDKGAKGGAPTGVLAQPAVKAVGGVGMEILRDIAAVRDALVNSVGTAWGGLKDATVEVFDHQYGAQAAATVEDSAAVVEGIANMGMAMKLTQPTQVLLTSAKESKGQTEAAALGAGDKAQPASSSNAQLAAEKAALERELAQLKAEKGRLAPGAEAPKQQKGPFGLPFAFGGAR